MKCQDGVSFSVINILIINCSEQQSRVTQASFCFHAEYETFSQYSVHVNIYSLPGLALQFTLISLYKTDILKASQVYTFSNKDYGPKPTPTEVNGYFPIESNDKKTVIKAFLFVKN